MFKPALALSLLFAVNMHAQTNDTFPLWPDGAPGALGKGSNDIPTLTVYLPDPTNATGAAMVICPGGGYGHLAQHEGRDYALWLNRQGVAGFVLKYRLGTSGYHHPAMLQDAARALRTVRARAAEWQVDSHRIGIMGSSAGGHLASTLVTHFDPGDKKSADPVERVSSRPDIAILCYPVIMMDGEFVHKGSRENLLGKSPSRKLKRELSADRQVTSNAPPCFVWTTYEDKTVPMENSLEFVAALRRTAVPCDFHVYEHGGHGMGLGTRKFDPDKWHPWTRDCTHWLKLHKFVDKE